MIPGGRAGHKQIEIECGASFGVGVYTSPDPTYSLMYADKAFATRKNTPVEFQRLRLIVCSVLMGMPLRVTRNQTRRTFKIANEWAHSHVSPCGLEYIVFDTSQVVPCYVIHLDLGAKAPLADLARIPVNPANWLRRNQAARRRFGGPNHNPGEVEREQQARKVAAEKWLPFGFGSASGTSFVIEEIGEISDDEEDYGQYQAWRICGDVISGEEIAIRGAQRLADTGSWEEEG